MGVQSPSALATVVVARIYKGGHMNTHDVYNVNLR